MKRLYVEVADTSDKRSTGLMYRDHLPENSGMLFDFGHRIAMSFWMKNTELPLDIAFLDDEFKIVEIKGMVPHSTKSVRSSSRHRYALEVNAGWFEKNDIGVGSFLRTARQISVQEPLDPQLDQTPSIPPATQDQPLTTIDQSPEEPPVEKQEVIVHMSFRDAVKVANVQDLAIAFEYEFPKGDINSYVLMPYDDYDIYPGREKELVRGRCVHSGGEHRNFIIDNIIDFNLYRKGDDNSWMRIENPSPATMDPDTTLVAACGEPTVKLSFDELKFIKESQSYSTSGQLMMTEYWDEIKKKKGKGKTEGQAILDYLAENSKRNSPQKTKRRKKKKR
jgi:uncharacterized membrane protein (UPF0127 family)